MSCIEQAEPILKQLVNKNFFKIVPDKDNNAPFAAKNEKLT